MRLVIDVWEAFLRKFVCNIRWIEPLVVKSIPKLYIIVYLIRLDPDLGLKRLFWIWIRDTTILHCKRREGAVRIFKIVTYVKYYIPQQLDDILRKVLHRWMSRGYSPLPIWLLLNRQKIGETESQDQGKFVVRWEVCDHFYLGESLKKTSSKVMVAGSNFSLLIFQPNNLGVLHLNLLTEVQSAYIYNCTSCDSVYRCCCISAPRIYLF